MVETWRAWVSAWTPWTLAAGEAREGPVSLSTRTSGAFAAVERVEHLGQDGALVKLRLTDTLDTSAVAKKYDWLLRELAKIPSEDDNRYTRGDERIVFSVETDPTTLRPQHARLERESHVELAATGTLPRHTVRDTTFDWAHAEGCKR